MVGGGGEERICSLEVQDATGPGSSKRKKRTSYTQYCAAVLLQTVGQMVMIETTTLKVTNERKNERTNERTNE